MFIVPPGTNVVPEPPDLVGGQYRGHHNVPTWQLLTALLEKLGIIISYAEV